MQEPNAIEIATDIEQLEDKTAPSGLAALDQFCEEKTYEHELRGSVAVTKNPKH